MADDNQQFDDFRRTEVPLKPFEGFAAGFDPSVYLVSKLKHEAFDLAEIVAVIAADELTATARLQVAQVLGVPADAGSVERAMKFRDEDRSAP